MESLKKVDGIVKEKSQKRGRRWALTVILSFLSKHYLAYWLLLLKDACKETTRVVGELYSIFMFEKLRNLHVGALERSENCLI